ncbi:predicted protein [Naegleria gruberi]|uniref:Predicted protein n=1 Tax=Naegleria gruberi TaxID=5762 RepID=D2VWF5_NAEGR|nr:uncharacterized protein NAEGRDRAFT_73362 [Naegleria gruberi]EFC38888.1 predicted protein [Naegleria gruberi]|eukprot:XP_002671632.1 predicted protein [Naegleria gruberi strain NEG-M]
MVGKRNSGVLICFNYLANNCKDEIKNKDNDDDDDGLLEILMEKIKSKLSGRKFNSENKSSIIGFSLNFQYETTIGLTRIQSPLNGQFDAPMDIKIDEKRALILVSDCGNRRVSVFDSYTKEFKFNIQLNSHPCTIQLDGEDGLIIACDNGHVFMYDLELGKFRWKTRDEFHREDSYLGSVYVNRGRGHVYIGDFNDGGVRVLDIETGIDIKGDSELMTIYWTRFAVGAYGMESLMDERMVISYFLKNSVLIVLDSYGALPLKLKSSFNGPRGICVDKTNQNIFVCDEGNDKIHIFDRSGNFIRSFGEYGTSVFCGFSGLFSCAINYQSGELLVADTNNYRIQIFR